MNTAEKHLEELLGRLFPEPMEREHWIRAPHIRLGLVAPALRITQGWLTQVIDLLESEFGEENASAG